MPGTSNLLMKMEKRKSKVIDNTDSYCTSEGLRLCSDGSCVTRLDLCPEEKEVNQNTIVIMVIVGIAVIIVMIILYCFQHRSRRLLQQSSQGALGTIVGDGDNLSLDNPPPTYDEVIGSNLYLPRQPQRFPSTEEPRTPPPNYDAALTILAQSNESFFIRKTEQRSSVIRRSISTETTTPSSPIRSPPSTETQRFEFRRNFSVSETS